MNKNLKALLKNSLQKLDIYQFKIFFTILASYWVEYGFFISDQSFFNLWCELNKLCHETDESFPDQYDDRDVIKTYCQQHPYYFIDMLCPNLVIELFCEHLDDRIDILTTMVQKLHTEGLRAAYESSNKDLHLFENVDKLVTETEKYLKDYTRVSKI